MKETNVIYIALSELHLNEGESGLPTNPRSIKDEKFKKLVLSVLMFPKMLSLRPIVVNSDNVILGGNMRYNALSEIAGYSLSVIRNKICRKEEYKSKPEQERNDIMSYWADFIKEPKAAVARADDMTLEQQKEFIIKDNSGFGEWDWDLLANEWDTALLEDWGVDVWQPEEPQEEPEQTAIDVKEDDTNDDDDEDNTDFFQMMLGDRIYDSDNIYDIPNLRLDEQPTNGLLCPFSAWGADTRQKKGIATYHFYVEDYRFEAIWKNPIQVINSGVSAIVEPNLSLFDTTPIAYGLQQIYKKRWISRYYQECGIKVYADLNVARKFREYNCMGIPQGYNAFATRGYADREEYLKEEIELAREISGLQSPNMIVYGGGEKIKELCKQNNVLYVEQFMCNQVDRPGKNVEDND